MRQEGVGYDGMIFRDVTDNGLLRSTAKRTVFVGFNALTPTERKALDAFRPTADYYFDYPDWIVEMRESAGRFAAENMERYKSSACGMLSARAVRLHEAPARSVRNKKGMCCVMVSQVGCR